MADYDGIMLYDPEEGTEATNIAFAGINVQRINTRDANAYSAGGSAPTAASTSVVVPEPLPSPLPNLLLFNWQGGITIESNFQVDVLRAYTAGEERRLLANRPQRSMSVRHLGLSRAEMTRILMNLFRHGNERVPIPLYSDHSRVTSAAANEIFCETAYRRFFSGQRFVIFDFDENNRPQNVEWGVIDNVAATHLVPTVSLTNTYGNARVYPMMDVEIVFRDEARLFNDQLGELMMTVREIPGPSALPPTASGNPTGYSTYDDLPIFDAVPDANFNYLPGMIRAGTQSRQGRGNVVYTQGDRPQATHSLAYRALTRASGWPLIEFFDSRRGRTRPFWLVSPQAMWEPTAITANDVTVAGNGNIDDVEDFHSHVAVVERDGTIQIRAIDNVVLSADDFRIDFDETITAPALGDIRRVCPAYKVRFEKNGMMESWTTDGIVDIQFEMIELLREMEITVICLQ